MENALETVSAEEPVHQLGVVGHQKLLDLSESEALELLQGLCVVILPHQLESVQE